MGSSCFRSATAAALVWLSATGAVPRTSPMLNSVQRRFLRARAAGGRRSGDDFLHRYSDCIGSRRRSHQLPLPQRLSGVSILVNNYYFAPVLAVADLGGFFQINFQVPLERMFPQKSSVQVVTVQPSGTVRTSQTLDNLDYPITGGFFADAQGIAVAQHVADGSPVTPAAPRVARRTDRHIRHWVRSYVSAQTGGLPGARQPAVHGNHGFFRERPAIQCRRTPAAVDRREQRCNSDICGVGRIRGRGSDRLPGSDRGGLRLAERRPGGRFYFLRAVTAPSMPIHSFGRNKHCEVAGALKANCWNPQ